IGDILGRDTRLAELYERLSNLVGGVDRVLTQAQRLNPDRVVLFLSGARDRQEVVQLALELTGRVHRDHDAGTHGDTGSGYQGSHTHDRASARCKGGNGVQMGKTNGCVRGQSLLYIQDHLATDLTESQGVPPRGSLSSHGGWIGELRRSLIRAKVLAHDPLPSHVCLPLMLLGLATRVNCVV